jgi:hypothetical protein
VSRDIFRWRVFIGVPGCPERSNLTEEKRQARTAQYAELLLSALYNVYN